ncbi:PucR family transcriptional regulator [Baekduia soli]|uniref:PucR family transcriptional regulator n=1 Tax=Baekduia soli TaxID=496014 RepID=A0A5B8TZS2_9ACTN|nr:helix-turn-helix domain-containing protein [Baekduia soli]QEC46215.1 PucR family transcriptional regulator [Baekduia soli]
MEPRLPSDLADALRPVLPGLAEEIISAIGREVPDYARPLEGPFGRALRVGVERALRRFVEDLVDPSAEDDDAREIYVTLGRGEMRAGRSLDALLSAYRLGARIAWERCVQAGQAAGHDPETLYRLASAIFSYIDRISAESVEGYADEQSTALAERQRRRRALVRLLARDDAGAEEVRDLAQLAVWPRPATVAGLVVRADDGDRLALRLGAEAIAVAEGGVAIAIVPDPDGPGRHGELEAALAGVPAALGPTVGLERAARSVARAQAALGLLEAGLLAAEPGALLVADEHLPALLLHGDGALAADLAARALAPLHEVRDGVRARLGETLRAWLDEPGQVTRVAERLHVHPQTVRYRVAQLRELFGERLDEPEARFELALAVRVSDANATATSG